MIEQLLGKTLTKAWRVGDDELYFLTDDAITYKMYHSQSCCENVSIEDITGDLEDLIGSPILVAEEASYSNGDRENGTIDPTGLPKDVVNQLLVEKLAGTERYVESCTWTFYKLATVRGYVDIRWYGSSNGYYSEAVDFVELNEYNRYH